MSGFGLPNITNPFDTAGVQNVSTRDLSPADPVKMAIIPVNEPYIMTNTLLLNPSSVAESKAANWVKHYVPGQSDPLLQWVSGSERTISFTAMVTKDLASNPSVNESKNPDVWNLDIKPELYDRVANATVPANILTGVRDLDTNVVTRDTLQQRQWSRSIQPQLDFYRSLVLPRDNKSINNTPPMVFLRMGTILGSRESIENQKFILLNYQFNITEYSPELEPTKAQVMFTFVEYVDKSKSSTAQTSPKTEANKPVHSPSVQTRIIANAQQGTLA